MSNTFEILAGFLDRFEDEVEGRELQEPPEAVRTKLGAFAKGELPKAEHEELLSMLRQNPGWVARLAAEVKALRADPRAKS